MVFAIVFNDGQRYRVCYVDGAESVASFVVRLGAALVGVCPVGLGGWPPQVYVGSN
jgi:hypothetical protein